MNRSVNLFRLFRNISSSLFILVFCLIAQPFEGAQSTDVQIFPESMNIAGTFMSGTPVTFTVDAAEQSAGTLYYKFFYCANYGTIAYESSPWVVMQEYSIKNSCTYTFPQDGSYIVVARVVADPNNEPVDLPIIGGVVTIGNGNGVHITSLSAGDSGAVNPGKPITYTSNASSSSGGTLYYKWFYCANYGTSAYATSPWVVVQDYSTENTCDFTFPSAGKYIIVVRVVTDPNNEPTDLPIIGAVANCNTNGMTSSGFSYEKFSGKSFYAVSDIDSCEMEIHFNNSSQIQFKVPDNGQVVTIDYTYTIEDGIIIIYDEDTTRTLTLLSENSDCYMVQITLTRGDNQWVEESRLCGINSCVNASALGSDGADGILAWVLQNGIQDCTFKPDGTLTCSGATSDSRWRVSNGVFYFNYNGGNDRCGDPKAYQMRNSKLYFSTDADDSAIMYWYFSQR
ncbi:MAG: hypothetical protein V2B19_28485 [Pseudomonadota bacterium]